MLVVFLYSIVSVAYIGMTPKGFPGVSARCDCRVLILALSQSFLYLFVAHDNTLMSYETSMRADQQTKLCKSRRRMRMKVDASKRRLISPSNYYWSSQGGAAVAVLFVLCSVLFHF